VQWVPNGRLIVGSGKEREGRGKEGFKKGGGKWFYGGSRHVGKGVSGPTITIRCGPGTQGTTGSTGDMTDSVGRGKKARKEVGEALS